MIKKYSGLICVLIFFFLSQESMAQVRDYSNEPGGNSRSESSNQQPEPIKEKAYVKYFFLNDIDTSINFQDTSLHHFEIFGRHREFENAAFNLGNYGSAHQKIIYKEERDIYTDIGYHQYDLNKLKLKDLKYYKINRAYNDLFFSPLSGQQNFEVKANFSKNFANDVNLSIDYERITQEGYYQDQENKMTRFGIGIWKHNEKNNHDLFISFLANNFNENFGGGVDTVGYDLDENFLGTTFRNPRNTAPTKLSSVGSTRHQQFTYAIDNFWTTKNEKFKLHHQISFENGYYRYGDDNVNTANDSLIYQSYLTDSRGIRSVNKFGRLSNQIDADLIVKNLSLTIGLKYKLLKFNDSLNPDFTHDLGLFGQVNFELGKVSSLNAFAELGVGENSGNIQLKGNLLIKPFSKLHIDVYANLLRYDPTLIQKSFVSTDQYVYQNDFIKTNALHFGGRINLKTIGITLEANTGLLDNPIYNNTESIPKQLQTSTEYFQAKVKQELFWKFIGIENSAIYQTFSDNIFNLPKVYSQHNFYLQSKLFKKRLLAKIGVLFYNTQFDGFLKFQPVNGSFYPTDLTTQYFPYSEIYGVFKVDSFRIFFKYNNAVDAIRKQVHYQIIDYPQFDAHFRLGVRWIISD